jgi:2,3-diketo-5-methylthio-1-phosphopentane phosphatase
LSDSNLLQTHPLDTLTATRSALLCDFDETVVDIDTGILILSKFANGDWRTLDELYNGNQMPGEEVIRLQFAMVHATKRAMLRLVEASTSLRPGFTALVQACSERKFPVVVASYGLDFCIDHVLLRAGLREQVKVHAPKARITTDGIRFSFPALRYAGSSNLKDDLVRHYRQKGYRVVYVGDGTSDFPAVKAADVRCHKGLKARRVMSLGRPRLL